MRSHPCTANFIGLYIFSPMYCSSFYLWIVCNYSHPCTAHSVAYSQMNNTWARIGSCKDEQYMREYGDSLFTRESTLRINSFAELDYRYMTGSKHKCNLYWLKWIQKYFHMISDINATLWWLVGEKWFEYRLACILWQALLSAHKITSLVLVRSLFTIYLTTTRRELSSD